jgi:hypothetical protein
MSTIQRRMLPNWGWHEHLGRGRRVQERSLFCCVPSVWGTTTPAETEPGERTDDPVRMYLRATARRKLGRQAIQRVPSGEMPPPGTIMWTWGWWVSAEAVRIAAIRHCFRKPPAHPEFALRFSQQQQTSIGRLVATLEINCELLTVHRWQVKGSSVSSVMAAVAQGWYAKIVGQTIWYVNRPLHATVAAKILSSLHGMGLDHGGRVRVGTKGFTCVARSTIRAPTTLKAHPDSKARPPW